MWSRNGSVKPNDPRQSILGSHSSIISGHDADFSLTVHLLAQPSGLPVAKEAPFLLAAAQGRLPKSVISKWISQERLVVQAQISLIGALLARVDLPYVLLSDTNKASSIRWRVVNMLSEALQRVHGELAYFTDLANRYNLDLEFPPRPNVFFTADQPAKQLIDLFRVFWTDPSMTLLEGLVVFWSFLYGHLTAFKYIGRNLNLSQRPDEASDGGVMMKELVPHWTSLDFEEFLAEVTEVTNMLGHREESWTKLDVFGAVWQHVLETQRRMWPDV